MAQQLKISPDHDPGALGRILRQVGRLQVSDFFTQESAEYLYKIHIENKDWYLAYNEGKNYYESSVEQIQAVTPQQHKQFMNSIYARARTQIRVVEHTDHGEQAKGTAGTSHTVFSSGSGLFRRS